MIDLHEHYRKQSYRNRCDILTANGTSPLIVPVLQPSGLKKTDPGHPDRFVEKMAAPTLADDRIGLQEFTYFVHYEERFAPFYRKRYEFLADLNAELQQTVFDLLQTEPEVGYSESYLPCPAPRRRFRDTLSRNRACNAPIRHSGPQPITRFFAERYPFAANLSIIDLLFCEGPAATGILQDSTVR